MRLAALVLGVSAATALVAAGAGAVSGTHTITTIAGTGSSGSSGDGGQATSAELNGPEGVATDAAGNVYIAEATGHRVRKVTPSGLITTVAGTGVLGFSGDQGAATAARLRSPLGLAVDGAGNLFIADSGNDRVRKVGPDGVITTVAGTGVAGFSGDGGQAVAAQLNRPVDVAVDGAGNLYIGDQDNHRVRKVTPDGVITTVAGTGVAGFSGDGGQATAAQLAHPSRLAVDGAGNLFIADSGNDRVRKVTPDGVIATIAGTGVAGFSGDGGQATAARLNMPYGVAVDRAGAIYIADHSNERVRKVAPDGVITTVAGTGARGFSGDGGPATSAQLYGPAGMAVDSAGALYVADIGNERVRKITPTEASPPSGGSPPGAEAQADVAVEADMIGAVATRSRIGVRVVRAELRLDERVSATLRLVRNGRTLASKRYASVRPGDRVLTLVVPRRVTKGRATLRVELADTAGNTLAFRRGVRIGRAG